MKKRFNWLGPTDQFPALRRARGFTLIELTIAIAIGLLLAGGIVVVFVNSRHSFDRDSSVLRMQDDSRQALRELVSDLSMAGYLTELVTPDSITLDGSLTIGSDCGPPGMANAIYQLDNPGGGATRSLVVVDNATSATASAAFSCLGADLVPGTDIIAVQRVKGTEAPAVLAPNSVYLRTNGTLGLLFQEPLGAPAVTIPLPYKHWEYRPAIYYVRNFALQRGDGIPTLCRMVLQYGAATPTVASECLAQGIENLQVEFGIDANGDGSVDSLVAGPTPAQLDMAISAEVYILARTADNDVRYTNDKAFVVSNAPAYVPNDNFYRRVYSTSVSLRNIRARRILEGR